MGSKVAIASCGMLADAIALLKKLAIDVAMYTYKHGREPGLKAVSQLLSVTLYSRRMFPFYTFNMLGGFDDEKGSAGCYHYDAVGSFEQVEYGTSGSGSALAHPVMDAIVQQLNIAPAMRTNKEPLSKEKLIEP